MNRRKQGRIVIVLVFLTALLSAYSFGQNEICKASVDTLGSRIRGGTGDLLDDLAQLKEEERMSISEATEIAFSPHGTLNLALSKSNLYSNIDKKIAIVINDQFSRKETYRNLVGSFVSRPGDFSKYMDDFSPKSHGALVFEHTARILRTLGFEGDLLEGEERAKMEEIPFPIYRYKYPNADGEIIIIISPIRQESRSDNSKYDKFVNTRLIATGLAEVDIILTKNKYEEMIYNLSWAILPCDQSAWEPERKYAIRIQDPKDWIESYVLNNIIEDCRRDADSDLNACVENELENRNNRKLKVLWDKLPKGPLLAPINLKFVVSSGNAGLPFAFAPARWEPVSAPESFIAVCGSKVNQQGDLYQDADMKGSNYGEVMMPGWWFEIETTQGEEVYYGGTSFAAPFVTVALALGIELDSLEPCKWPNENP